MPITLHRMIMHRIDKTQHETDGTPTYKENLFTNSTTLSSFVESLSETYNKKTSKEYANFRTGENIPEFQRILDSYLINSNDDSFKLFSRQATELLSIRMNSKPASTGGFIVVIDYTSINRFILIALVNEKEGYTENNLDILRIEQLNIDQLGMAGFVNIDNYQNNDTSYRPLSFMRGTREVSDYFSLFLGADTNIETSSHMTGVLINVLKDFYREKDFDQQTIEAKSQTVYAFCDEKRQNREPVNVSSISSLLDPDNPNEFFEFSQEEENNYDLNTVIESIHKQKLNNLKSFSIKGDGFRISFDRELYNDTIALDDDNKLIVSGLPQDFINQLRQEFNNQNDR